MSPGSDLDLVPPGSAAPLPEWQVDRWLNAPEALRVADLRGRVVLVHAFQMLCPACVTHGVPQAVRVHEAFGPDVLAVIGLHTVFEHHAAMAPHALEAFVHEFRLRFPIGIDAPSEAGPVPRTMGALGLHGTPTVLLLDRQGRLRAHGFGVIDDLSLGVALGCLLAEPA